MTTVVITVLACLYVAGIIIAGGDALLDEAHERKQAREANMPILRATAEVQAAAAHRRFGWSLLWPVLFITALRRLRDETYAGRTR